MKAAPGFEAGTSDSVVKCLLGLKSKCRVRWISSVQIDDNEIRDIKPHYYIVIHMNFLIFPILSKNDKS